MDRHQLITGYCQTQRRKHSVIIKCIDAGMGKYIKGRVECDFVKNGGNCNGNCSIWNSIPREFHI